MEQVILVDIEDNPIGLMEKMEAHQKGLLHRAFSVFVFNDKNELLLQQRALHKYHSGGLWTNTCCSHPRDGEELVKAGTRRLQEEMGFECEITPVLSFIYKAELDNELTEHEFDHVLIGKYNVAPQPNPDEVSDWKFVNLEALALDLAQNPDHYTIWFQKIFEKTINHFLNERY
ncbi:MAG: isopentenyl-diphosphate Delta-isomerase [Crocinitomix sp.]|nr:isopentenyl-diphosphate Delta-isomerase [Crocinitomix sp.]